MTPTLLVLAAGRSTRYGATKQLEAVGPGNVTLIDYALYDARRAGFGHVVVVVSPDLEPRVRERIVERWQDRIRVDCVKQDEPRGTAGAVLAARSIVDGPFAVVNGDDFYGAGSFAAVGAWLAGRRQVGDRHGPVPEYALVTFRLRDTLPDTGAVNRAIVTVSNDGWLVDIREVVGIERNGDGGAVDGGRAAIPGDTPVSMNLWGLTPAIFPQIAGAVRAMRETQAAPSGAECLLPNVVGDLVRRQTARVRAITGGSRWRGLTHRGDLAAVRALIAELTAAGEYPPGLF